MSAGRHERGVLDTDAVIDLERLPPDRLPLRPQITTVTLAELSIGPLTARSEAAAVERQTHLQLAEDDFDPLPFDVAAARAFARVSASLRRAGRKTKARTFDAMIAAIALAEGLPVYTCNPDDFTGIEGLQVIAIPAPAQQR